MCMHDVKNHIYCKHAWLDLAYSFDLWCFSLFWVSVAFPIFYCFVCENRRRTRMERKTPNEVCCNNNNFNAYLHGCARSDMTIEFANLLVNDYSLQVYFLLLAWCLVLGVCFPCLVLAAWCLFAMLAACRLLHCCLLPVLGAWCLVVAPRAWCLLLVACCLFALLGD